MRGGGFGRVSVRGEVGAEGTDASDTVIFDELLIFSDLCLFVGGYQVREECLERLQTHNLLRWSGESRCIRSGVMRATYTYLRLTPNYLIR